MNDDEEILPGPLKGIATKEEKEVYYYKPPPQHRVSFNRRVVQVQDWVKRHGWVQQEDVIRYIEQAFQMERSQALKIFAQVKKDFERSGRLRGQ